MQVFFFFFFYIVGFIYELARLVVYELTFSYLLHVPKVVLLVN